MRPRPASAGSSPPGAAVLGPAADAVELAERVERGLPAAAAGRLAAALGVPRAAVLGALLAGEAGPPGREGKRRRLGLEAGRRALGAVRAAEAALALFGDEAAAARWLSRPQQEFGGAAPWRHALTPEGERAVVAVLGRAAHGVY